jgi:predicted metal-binding membrane protein
MMTAMMLPSVAPFASLYTRTMRGHRVRRISLLGIEYSGAGTAGFSAPFSWAA